ncbi:hypothetical protein [Flavobacterium sp. S87F.05.LMB.W.Kidney.N]|nr:hypothetical protein [Flavobacterium sp. S87F.05.LMB.W.Kidney.N]
MGQQKDWSIDEIQNVWQLVSKLHDGQKYGGVSEGERVELTILEVLFLKF